MQRYKSLLLMKTEHYFFNQLFPLEEINEGLSRKVLAYNENLMIVEVHFNQGVVGALHSHPHEQITYILEGVFEFTIDGETKIVRAGDSMYKEPNVVHGAVCIETGKLLDIFTPHREDFIKK